MLKMNYTEILDKIKDLFNDGDEYVGIRIDCENIKAVATGGRYYAEYCPFFPTKTIWLYTGYTWEDLQKIEQAYTDEKSDRPSPLDIIELCDVIVDGPYIDKLRDITLPFRGSSNQRIIDVQKSLKENQVVLWNT